MRRLFVILLILNILLCSCERGEPLNLEADIISVKLYESDNDTSLIGYKMNVMDNTIPFYIPVIKDITKIIPKFTLSDGASIYPPSGNVYDFTNGVKFTVTSENGEWQRVFTVKIDSVAEWKFDFEDWTTVTSGNLSYMEPKGWTSANKGVLMLCESLGMNFPTYRTTDAYSGNYALEMCSRFGSLDGGIIPPLVSGSAFTGNFNTKYLMTNKLACAEFGVPFNYNGINKPVKLIAKIKYIPGPVFTDENAQSISGKVDKFSFYAVFFWGDEPLSAANMNSTNRIIAKAELKDDRDFSVYTPVEVYFDYKSYGNNIPLDKNLQLAIIAGSSAEGDYYRGAVGSTLTIDDVEIVFE